MKNHKVRYKNNLSYDMVDFFKRKSIYCSDPTAYRNVRDVYMFNWWYFLSEQ